MSTLHKVKAYFGMAPMDDYEDEYYEDDDRDTGPGRGFSRRSERFVEDAYEEVRPAPRYDDLRGDVRGAARYDDRDHYDEPDYAPTGGFRAGYAEEPRYRTREFERPHDLPPRAARLGAMRGSSTRGALAMDPRRMAMLFEEGSPLSKITTLRPKDYNEARTIGERFRDGQPVIMDLVSMDNADAKRLVDFAVDLAFALRGSFDKVATKVFLLAPADVDVSAEERRRIAEAGFYSYQ